MSIEKLLTELIEAIRENTAALSGSATSPTPKPSAKKTTAKKTAAKKSAEITVDALAKRVGEYLKTGSKEDREIATKSVMAIVKHFDAERITKIDPEHFPEVVRLLDAYEAGEDPLADVDEEESII